MKMIVAVDANWGIGYQGRLLKRIPEDMKQFKQMTIGKVVVMGRETFESLPGKEPLSGRTNIVLSKNCEYINDRVIICRSLEELFELLKKYPTDDVFIIGGESIYAQLLPYCSEAYVTQFADVYPADKHLTNLDKNEAWEKESDGELKTHDDVRFRFTKYINKIQR